MLSSVRTVYAFNGQKKELERYEHQLVPAKKNGIKRAIVTASGLAMMWLVIYSSYGLAFWYGVRLIIRSIDNNNTQYEPSTMITVFFCVLMGAFSSGQSAPYFEAFGQARGAATLIFEIINRTSEIDSSSEKGKKLNGFKGEIKFQNVYFNYPARPDVRVLNGIDLIAEPGQTVALVGQSGCGKSTLVQIIQRFYDVQKGKILVDGIDIRDLNVGWLREQIGIVGQEPVLFNCSIAENIQLGKPSASIKEIQQAAIDANAHDFIMRLPQQYDTLVGERGSQLSGGQKQRIAIARALVSNPKILLLDESTSALDLHSESVVQAALDKASIGRTTFIVAHRLSTVKNADKIIVIDNGEVKEIGTHSDLIASKGLYYMLVQTQQRADEESEQIDEEETNSNNNLLLRTFSVESATDSRKYSVDASAILKKDKVDDSVSAMRLLRLMNEDKFYVMTGAITSLIMGLSTPAYAFLFGDILGELSGLDKDTMQKNVLFYSIMFCIMGIVSGTATFLQVFLLYKMEIVEKT